MKVNSMIVGVLLAGGMSSRYGSPKAFARLNGEHFYEIAYKALESVCQHVIIVTRQELIAWFQSDLHIIVDHPLYVGDGPLAGIYSAMEHVEADTYVVLPCDMPLITVHVLDHLVNCHENNVSVAAYNGKIQPLVSVWNYNMKNNIYIALENRQFKMKEFLSKVRAKQVAKQVAMDDLIQKEVFMNINTPENKKELRKWKLS